MNKIFQKSFVLTLAAILVLSGFFVPSGKASAVSATLFGPDSFTTDLKWDNVNISGSSDTNRTSTSGTFTVGASGNGLLFQGSNSGNPDDASERIIATLGKANLTVNYSISTENLSGSDEFLVQYSLDGSVFTTSKTYTSANAPLSHTADTFNISNPNHAAKLVVRFVVNADSSSDKVGIDNVEVTGYNAPNYYDGFESGLVGWTNSGAAVWTTDNSNTDVNGASNNIKIWTATGNNNAGQSVNLDSADSITKTFSTTGFTDIHVNYSRKTDSLEAAEDFKVQYTIDGTTWTTLETLSGATGNADDVIFGSQSFSLPASANDNASFGLRFVVDGSDVNDDVWIDDVVVWGTAIPSDTTPPDTTITVNPANPANSSSATFEFTSTETGIFECQIDGGGFSVCTTPKTYTGLTDSSHQFDVMATDAALNPDPTPASYTWTIDTIAPTASITYPATGTTIKGTVTITADASDSGSGVAKVEFYHNPPVPTYIGEDTSAPYSFDWDTSGVSDGSHSIYIKATDNSTNTTGYISIPVTVDNNPPVLSLPGDMTVEATGPTGATVTYTATANDTVDGSTTVVCTPASGSDFSIGTTAVSCGSSDNVGNTATGSFNVTVQDTTGPVISELSDITVEADSLGGGTIVNFSATAEDIVAGSVSVDCTPASGSVFPLGTNLVTCTATDGINTSTKLFSVIVQDTTAPVLVLSGDITAEATSPSGANVEFTATAVDVVDGSVAAECSATSGSLFPLGLTTVNCSASDSIPNTSSGSFNVTVQDTTAPTFVINNGVEDGPVMQDVINITVTDSASTVATSEYGFSADEACDATDTYGNAFTSGSDFYVNTDHTDYLCIKATDSVGNTGYALVGKLNVDATAPLVTQAKTQDVNGDGKIDAIRLTFSEPINDSMLAAGAADGWDVVGYDGESIGTGDTANDNMLLLAFSQGSAVDTDATPTVTYTQDIPTSTHDLVGNQLESGSWTAVDGVNPVITTVNPATASAKSKTITASANEGTLTQSVTTGSVCDGTLTFADYASTTFSAEADNGNKICYKAIDASENITYKMSDAIAGIDTTAPVITVPADITTSTTDSSGVVVTYTAPTANDAVDGAVTATCDKNSGDKFPIGTTTVNCSAIDAATNSATKTFTVTVNLTQQNNNGGGGGGGGGALLTPAEPALIITDLNAPSITTSGFTLTWTTNVPSSSYVIYGAEGENHTLDMNDNAGTPPLFGYAHATAEFDTDPKVTSHSVTVTGLTPLTTYYFRTVSRGSLAVSAEDKTTTPAVLAAATTAGETTGGQVTTAGETGAVEQTQGSETSTAAPVIEQVQGTAPVSENSAGEQVNPYAAGFLGVAQQYFWPLLIIFAIVVVGYIIYSVIIKRRKK